MEFEFKSGKLLMVPALAVLLYPGSAFAQHYTQTNLVSDVAGAAAVLDPNLVNAWGLTRSSTSPWWVADNAAGVSTLYSGTGQIIPINGNGIVIIPPPKNAPAGTTSAPTGAVFNGSTDFVLPAPNGKPAVFIFATEDGTIFLPWITTIKGLRMAQSIRVLPPRKTMASDTCTLRISGPDALKCTTRISSP
jgi:uncharacterized protein (TIGR03118 family)